MKKSIIISFIFSLILANSMFAQSTNENSELNSSGLMYSPQLPKKDSYKIVKNDSGSPVSEAILLEINKYRKSEDNFTWRVNDKIEILIYPIKK
jgi:hypothetical protein